MTNKERQKRLDLERWYESEKHNGDMSGLLPYCRDCKHRNKNYADCDLSYTERTQTQACATAYNKMKKNGVRS